MAPTSVELETEAALAAGGDAVARAEDGRIVFIEGAAPEERVRVEITRTNARFLRGRVIEILRPSVHRVEPRCRHFAECGGCTLQHLSPASQLANKQEALLETLRRLGGIDTAALHIDAPWSGAAYGYRTRTRFQVRRGKAGYQRARSNEVFDAKECPILCPPLEALLVGFDRRAKGEVSALSDGVRATIDETLEVESRFGPLLIASHVFGQANDAGNDALLEHLDALLAERAPIASALELYAGSGNFTRVLARRAERVTMVESDRAATTLARKILPLSVEIAELEAEHAPADPVDVVLVDPPRAGMSEPALARAAEGAVRALLYVSCDPATFARDSGRLAERGLTLISVRLFDLYPQTAHAEVVGAFERKSQAIA